MLLTLTTGFFSQRLRNWYGYHPDRIERAKEKSPASPASLPLSIIPKQRKPAPIVPWQAYSKLYFKEDTALHKEVHIAFEDFKAGVESVRAKYSHLFPDLDEAALSTINWLPFYQAVMAEYVKSASAEELSAVAEHINARYQREVSNYERPWNSIPGNESEVVKKRKYLAEYVALALFSISFSNDTRNRQIDSLPGSLGDAYQEIEDLTNYRFFTLVGGPAPEGGGSLSVMRVQTGRTLNNQEHGDFQTFLGDIYPLLKEKWCQWLATSYSKWAVSSKFACLLSYPSIRGVASHCVI